MMPGHTVKFRPFDRIEVTDEPIFGNRSQGKVAEIVDSA
jgi:hypothetical protein